MNRLSTSIILCGALLIAAGSATAKDRPVISVTPAGQALTAADGRADLDVTFSIPRSYFSKRSRIVITPTLFAGDTAVQTLAPVAVERPIYTKKRRRLEVLRGYIDPFAASRHLFKSGESYTLPYRATVAVPSDGADLQLRAVVSTDGCGECTGIDTLTLASIGRPAPALPKLHLNWIEPEFVVKPKVMEGKGEANLQFIINRHDIRLDLGDNRRELYDMVATLSPVVGDSLATLTSLQIYGTASADGPLRTNTPLAKRRANAAAQWLEQSLSLPPRYVSLIEIGSRPEGWEPVLAAMQAAGDPDTTAVSDILAKYAGLSDDVAERYIRRLPCWDRIKNRYLQKDRKVEYAYTYRLKSFTTDAELLDMYGKRPDAFSETELLRVAAITPGDEAKRAVLEYTLSRYPDSRIAANNLAYLWLQAAGEEQARAVLAKYNPQLLKEAER